MSLLFQLPHVITTILMLFTKLSSSSVSFRYGIPFSYHNPKGTGDGTGQFQLQFRFRPQLRLRILFKNAVATIIPGKHSYVPSISPTIDSTIISIIFFDSALTTSINKDHLSNFDSSNNPSTSLLVDSVLEPFQVHKVYPSSILHVDPSVVPSFNLNHDPNHIYLTSNLFYNLYD